ncbi:MAG: LamG domain-containing protein, partial [Chthoniobacterales bacterium]
MKQKNPDSAATRTQSTLWLLIIAAVAVLTTSLSPAYNRIAKSRTNDIAVACVAPPPNMISWFPGDGNAQDILSNAQELSTRGGVTYTTGKVAQAFAFDGTGDVTYDTINAGSAYTVDFWVLRTRTNIAEYLFSNTQAGNTFGEIRIDPANGIQYDQGSSFRVASGSANLPLNVYTHVALTYDGSVNRLYINGNLVSTSGAHTETLNSQITLGARMDGSQRFAGQLDEVEIFDRALSDSELQSIVGAGSSGKCKTLVDDDGDGIVNNRDACPGTPPGTAVNASGCPVSSCFPPPANLNNWFPGDGNAQDIRSNAIPLIESGVSYPAGKVAQAFQFDGTGNVTYDTINAGAAYTVDFWVLRTRANIAEYLFSNTQAGNTFGEIRIEPGNGIQYDQSGIFRVASGSANLPLNVYTHVALTYDGSVNRLYINGNLVSTSGVHTETLNSPITLGARMDGGFRFVGQLDEI